MLNTKLKAILYLNEYDNSQRKGQTQIIILWNTEVHAIMERQEGSAELLWMWKLIIHL